ncbi:MAG: ABC transporter permease, partial [Thermodesulfobacteriota bacterium]
MAAFLLKRTIVLFLTLFLVSMVIFAVLMVIPGDPAQVILGIHATPETLQKLRQELGLDRPAIVQYLAYMKHLALGDMGRSINYDIPIRSLIFTRLEVTLPLAILSMVFAVLL